MVHRDPSEGGRGSFQSANSFLKRLGYHSNSDNGDGMPRRTSSNGLEPPKLSYTDRQNSGISEKEEEHHYQVINYVGGVSL